MKVSSLKFEAKGLKAPILKFEGFDLGKELIFSIFFLNAIVIIMYVYGKNEDNPGITIYWLCCMKVAMTGKYSYQAQIKRLEKSEI